MKIKALFVDLGGVLIINRLKEISERFENEYKLTPDKTQNIFKFIQTGNRSKEQINNYIMEQNVDPETWEKFSTEFYSSESRNESLINLLKIAKKQGILIVYTTNNSDSLQKIMEKYEIVDLADLIINSSQLKIAKPEKEFWEAAYRETEKRIPNIQVKEILVIDDSRSNCESAQEFGLQVYKYKNEPNSLTELTDLLNNDLNYQEHI